MSNSALSKNIIALNDKVKADSGDSSAGYLADKVDGSTIKVNSSLHQLEALGWELISEISLSSDSSYVEWTGLSGGVYMVFFNIRNTVTSDNNISLFINGDTTQSNYYYTVMYARSAGVGASNNNYTYITYVSNYSNGNCCSVGHALIEKDNSGYTRAISVTQNLGGGSLENRLWSVHHNASITSISSIRLQGQYSMKAGSKFRLLRLKTS